MGGGISLLPPVLSSILHEDRSSKLSRGLGPRHRTDGACKMPVSPSTLTHTKSFSAMLHRSLTRHKSGFFANLNTSCSPYSEEAVRKKQLRLAATQVDKARVEEIKNEYKRIKDDNTTPRPLYNITDDAPVMDEDWGEANERFERFMHFSSTQMLLKGESCIETKRQPMIERLPPKFLISKDHSSSSVGDDDDNEPHPPRNPSNTSVWSFIPPRMSSRQISKTENTTQEELSDEAMEELCIERAYWESFSDESFSKDSHVIPFRHLQMWGVRLKMKVGEGSSGSVWVGTIADDIALTEARAMKRCIVKVPIRTWGLSKDSHEDHDIFYTTSERRLLDGLEHPNIVKLLTNIDITLQHHLLVFEEYEHGNMEMVMKKYKDSRMPLGLIQRIMHGLVAAVMFIHSQNMVHRNIKPTNIMMDEHMDVKLGGFGYAAKFHILTEDMGEIDPAFSATLGTVEFMAPEVADQREHMYGQGCDVWSIGAVLYTMLNAGVPPFRRAIHAVSQAVSMDDTVDTLTDSRTADCQVDSISVQRERQVMARVINGQFDALASGPIEARKLVHAFLQRCVTERIELETVPQTEFMERRYAAHHIPADLTQNPMGLTLVAPVEQRRNSGSSFGSGVFPS